MEVSEVVLHLGNIILCMSPSVIGLTSYSIIVCVIVVRMMQKNVKDKLFLSQKRHISQCRPVCKIVVGVTGAGFQELLVRRQKKYLTDVFKTIRVFEFLKMFPSHCTLKNNSGIRAFAQWWNGRAARPATYFRLAPCLRLSAAVRPLFLACVGKTALLAWNPCN